jgi:hypothetical protein
VISHWILLRMRNVSKVVGKIITHFVFYNSFPQKSISLWDNLEEHGRHWQATESILYSTCALHVGYRYAEYVILIAFPRRQWSLERTSMLRYMPITCLVLCSMYASTHYIKIMSIKTEDDVYHWIPSLPGLCWLP